MYVCCARRRAQLLVARIFDVLGLAHCRLEHICAQAFCETGIGCIDILDSVVELSDECLCACKSLWRVGLSSKQKRICAEAFSKTPIALISIPDSVVELGEKCSYWCTNLPHVQLSPFTKLAPVGAEAFHVKKVAAILFPDSVVELS